VLDSEFVFRETLRGRVERAEVLIIGAGASGGVAAGALSEAGFDVVCLEQGEWPDRASYPAQRPTYELEVVNDPATGTRRLSNAVGEVAWVPVAAIIQTAVIRSKAPRHSRAQTVEVFAGHAVVANV
jgi:choline dehydrogenase-like flavoprotein